MKSELVKGINEYLNISFGSGGTSNKQKTSNKSNKSESSNNNFIEIDDSTFENKVQNGKKPAILFFYAPWCGHCQNLKPEWKKAASKLSKFVDFFQYDADKNKRYGGEFGVQGFPTLFWFDKNIGNRKTVKKRQYNGGRTEQDLVNWINKELSKSINLSFDIYEV